MKVFILNLNMKDFINKIDIYQYFGKGGVSRFIKEFGIEIYNDIIKYTSELNDSVSNNRKFTARLYYIKYLNSNYYKITNENLSFNGKTFVTKSKNSAKTGWINSYNKTTEIYGLEETINKLKDELSYKNYLGKAKNRTLLKEDPILFNSIYYHTKYLDSEHSNYKKLSHRILFLVNDYDMFCNYCGKKMTWKTIKEEIQFICSNCKPKFPSREWFKNKYGDEYTIEYDNYFNEIRNMKTNSLLWYKEKYNDEIGEDLYRERYLKQLKKISDLKKNRYSKISQELFFEITTQLKNKNEIYFHDHNGEYFIKIPKTFKNLTNSLIYFVDFKYKNKIIEYNGKYWHNEKNDNIRYSILNKLGYDVLIITSDEYNRNYKPTKTITKILKFLENAD